jgi:hypothetical protein
MMLTVRNFLRRRRLVPAVALLAAMLIVPPAATAQDTITTDSGLSYIDTKQGAGPAAKAGQSVAVHYTGWLYHNGEKGKNSTARATAGGRSPFRSAPAG